MVDHATTAPGIEAAAAAVLVALAGVLGAVALWVRARAAREERERRTAAQERPPDTSAQATDRTADVVARLQEIDRARLRMPASWEADVDARIEAKALQIRGALAELGERVNELAAEQSTMRQSWEPVLVALRSLTAAVEERLPCLHQQHEEHGPPTWRPGDRPRSDR